MVKTFNIKTVVSGTVNPDKLLSSRPGDGGRGPYEVAMSQGAFVQVESGSALTTDVLVRRIVQRRESFLKRNASKEVAEKEYFSRKEYVAEA